jgi:hypothetical protein
MAPMLFSDTRVMASGSVMFQIWMPRMVATAMYSCPVASSRQRAWPCCSRRFRVELAAPVDCWQYCITWRGFRGLWGVPLKLPPIW